MYNTPFHTADISDKKFLITGGAGFIGSHISEYLLKYGAGKVRVFDNLSTGLRSNIDLLEANERFEFFEGDLRNYSDCLRACKDIHVVSHQAALGSVPRSIKFPLETNEVNVDGFLNMLNAAKESNIRRFVYASSSSVYGDELSLPKKEEVIGNPLSPYAVTKHVNEQYALVYNRLHEIETIGFRYFNVFGPRQDPESAYAAVIPLFVDAMLNGSNVNIDGDGFQTRDFTYIENVVQINVKAMLTENKEAFGKAYNVAIGENYTIMQLFNGIKGILGVSSNPNHRSAREGDIRDSLADISQATELLNYTPEVKFEDGLINTVKYFKSLATNHE